LWSVCDYGYCGSPSGRRLTVSDLDDFGAPDSVVDAVLAAEGLSPIDIDNGAREQLRRLADDWLFAPSGRGARSGLPR
jgi:hypothetical protein